MDILKACENCGHSALPDGQPIRFNSLQARFCAVCVQKNPQLAQTVCPVCRKRHDATRGAVCSKCSASAGIRTALGAISPAKGGPLRTVPAILQGLGLPSTDRAARSAAADWLREKGYPEGVSRGVVAFRVTDVHDKPDDVHDLLAAAGLEPGGPVQTVTSILQGLGIANPDRGAISSASAWLRQHGHPDRATCGRRGFCVQPRLRPAGADPTFRQWAETYRCADALGLSTHDRDRYLAGAEPPLVVRLAMSALIAGLPAYSACVTGNNTLE